MSAPRTLLQTQSTTAPLLRRETWEGRAHLIVPVVPIVAGVLNEYLVPAEEISRFVESWNGIPLPIGHPMQGTTAISANSPQQRTQSLGYFFHAFFAGDRLKGELWIDLEKATALGGDALRVAERLEAGEPLEVSTAFWADDEATAGTFNGTAYQGIHRNLRPDHLALLPHAIGACSWQDGCGAPRIHAHCGTKGCTMAETPMKQSLRAAVADFFREMWGRAAGEETPLLHAQMTDTDLRENLQSLLQTEYGEQAYCYLEAIEADRAIYRKSGKLLARPYTLTEGLVAFTGDEVPVQRNTTFTPITNAAETDTQPPASEEQKERTPMPIPQDQAAVTERVTRLIAHSATAWQESDRSTLSTLAVGTLDALLLEAETRRTTTPQPAPPIVPSQATAKTTEEYLAEAPPEVRDVVTAALRRDREHREQLLTTLMAQKQCPFSAQELQACSTEHLEKLTRVMAPADYAGHGFPVANRQGTAADDNQPPAPPDTLGLVVQRHQARMGRVA